MNKDKVLDKVESDIAKYGWHCLSVNACEGEDGSPFTYTIGLQATFDHPEIMIFGLGNDVAHGILTDCVDLIKRGSRFHPNEEHSGVIGGDYTVVFKKVLDEHLPEYFGVASRYYGITPFSALIMFWPNKEHHFPWDSSVKTPQEEALGIIF